MTISTAYSALTYAGNGTTTAFPVTWPFHTGTLVVALVSGTTETVKTLGTHYTVSGGTDAAGLASTGTVTMLSAPATGQTLKITRATPLTQSTAWSVTGAFNEVSLESALDRGTLIDQEIWLPVSQFDDRLDTLEDTVANLEDYPTLTSQYLKLDDISDDFNGTLTTFALTYSSGTAFTPGSAAQLIVHLNGVYQEPLIAYTVSGTNITFTTAPISGDEMIITALVTIGGAGSGSSGGGGDSGTTPTYEGGDSTFIPIVTTNPESGQTGEIIWNEGDGYLYVWKDGAWEQLAPPISAEDITTGLYSSGLRPIELLDALPSEDNVEGRMVYLSTDGILYIYTSTGWQPLRDVLTPVAPSGIEVFATDPTEGNYEGRVIFNTTDNQLKRYTSGSYVQVVEPITAAEEVADGSITTAKFASGITPVEIVGTLPTTSNFQGRMVLLTTDNKLYRYTGSAFTAAVPAGDITGTVSGSQIADGAIDSDALAANAVIAGKIAAGAISATEIASGAITTAKLAADAVTAEKIAALAIDAEAIAANAVTADKVAANAITAGKVAAGAIGADQIQAGAITVGKLGANSISTANLQAGIITSTHLASASITAAAIQSGAVTSDKIASNAITAGKIQTGALDGTVITGATVRTGSGSDRAEMSGSSNALTVYYGSSQLGKFGGTVASGFLEINGAFGSGDYPGYFRNTSSGNGTLYVESAGGYTIEAQQKTANASYYAAVMSNIGGNYAAMASSSYALITSGTVSPFTGSHQGFALKGETFAVGDIVVDGDVISATVDDSVCYAERSTTEGQAGVVGVFGFREAVTDDSFIPAFKMAGALTTPTVDPSLLATLKSDYDLVCINSIGEGAINVCGRGGNIAKGDLIVSSTLPGKGQKQSDDIVRSYTVARARQAYTFSDPDEVALIACIYLCG